MIRLAPGTKENLGFKLTDILPSTDAITTLVGLTPTFDIVRADEAETPVITGQAASISTGDPMLALCFIDTTLTGGVPVAPLFPEGKYWLFFKYTNSPEVPRLGPFPFLVDD